MNNDYIKREDISKFANKIKSNFAPLHRPVIDAVVHYMTENIPAADVVPVRHGDWEEYQIPHIICCSECDWGTGVEEKQQFKFCPNCGAEMTI